MTLNRLIAPRSEHAMPDWFARTALADILGTDSSGVDDDALYRHLDRLHPKRAEIEAALAKREERLFNLDGTVYLYDLTSSYFEGQCLANGQAKRGHSKDHRPDCKQVVVGLVVDREGFPKAHEVFDGNRSEGTTLGEMLERLKARAGPAATVIGLGVTDLHENHPRCTKNSEGQRGYVRPARGRGIFISSRYKRGPSKKEGPLLCLLV